MCVCFFFSSRRRHTRWRISDWSSDVCSSDLCERFGRSGLRRVHQLQLADERVEIALPEVEPSGGKTDGAGAEYAALDLEVDEIPATDRDEAPHAGDELAARDALDLGPAESFGRPARREPHPNHEIGRAHVWTPVNKAQH